jgi:hypothetical protein
MGRCLVEDLELLVDHEWYTRHVRPVSCRRILVVAQFASLSELCAGFSASSAIKSLFSSANLNTSIAEFAAKIQIEPLPGFFRLDETQEGDRA